MMLIIVIRDDMTMKIMTNKNTRTKVVFVGPRQQMEEADSLFGSGVKKARSEMYN